MAHDVTLILGDGTGPELAEAARRCVDATGVKINWDPREAGVDVMERLGTPLPDSVMESVRRTKCALKAPITTPVGTGFRSINVHLRQALGLFACIRPCKQYPGVRTFFNSVPVDLVIVRENTEDLYAGIEHMVGPDAAESIKIITRAASERIARYAFDYAVANGRRKVTAVHKANIMKLSDGLFLESVRTVAKVHLRQKDEGPTIQQIDLETHGRVPGIDQDHFAMHAEEAKQGCPVSRALAGVEEINLDARLES